MFGAEPKHWSASSLASCSSIDVRRSRGSRRAASASCAPKARRRRRDGTRFPVGYSVSRLVNLDGTALGALVLFQDLSEIARLRDIAARGERLAVLGRLSAGLAHEIRNPLSSISGSVQLVRESPQPRRRGAQAARHRARRGRAARRSGDHDAAGGPAARAAAHATWTCARSSRRWSRWRGAARPRPRASESSASVPDEPVLGLGRRRSGAPGALEPGEERDPGLAAGARSCACRARSAAGRRAVLEVSDGARASIRASATRSTTCSIRSARTAPASASRWCARSSTRTAARSRSTASRTRARRSS